MGAFGIALRLNWLRKKRCRNTPSHLRISRSLYLPRQACQAQERDLGRRVAEPQDVVQVEVLQLVRADDARCLALLAAGHQLGRDLGVQDRAARASRRRRTRPVGHPADQVLDQRLRHAGVHVVVRHVVAHAVGAQPSASSTGRRCRPPCRRGSWPAGRGARCARRPARSRTSRRRPFCPGERVADVVEHLHARWPDIDLLGGDAQRLHQPPGLALGARRWWRSRASCRRGCSRAAGRARPSPARRRSAPGSSRARRRRRSPASRCRWRAGASPGRAPGCGTPPRSAVARVRVGRHVGEARLVPPLEQQPACRRGARSEGGTELRAPRGGRPARRRSWSGACGPGPAAPGRRRRRSAGRPAKRSDSASRRAVLVDQRVAVPGEVGGRLAEPRGAVEIGREAARRLASASSWR